MVIILCLYFVALLAVFSKFCLAQWCWSSETILLPRVYPRNISRAFKLSHAFGTRTVDRPRGGSEPNVTGQIVAIPVKPNVVVKANDGPFQIEPAPFQYKVSQLPASLAAAKQQQPEILKSNYEEATANIAGLTAQVVLARRAAIRTAQTYS